MRSRQSRSSAMWPSRTSLMFTSAATWTTPTVRTASDSLRKDEAYGAGAHGGMLGGPRLASLTRILEQRIDPWLVAGRHAPPQPDPVPGNGSSAAKPTAAWVGSLNTRASWRRWRGRRAVPTPAGRVWRIVLPGRGTD